MTSSKALTKGLGMTWIVSRWMEHFLTPLSKDGANFEGLKL